MFVLGRSKDIFLQGRYRSKERCLALCILALLQPADAVARIEMPLETIANHTTASLLQKGKRPTPGCKPLTIWYD